MNKTSLTLLAITLVLCFLISPFVSVAQAHVPGVEFRLGSEVLFDSPRYYNLIKGKRIGLVTNQTGVDSQGVSTVVRLASDPSVRLAALFCPEHGLDGTAPAGSNVKSYTHPTLNIPVYSLYGSTRKPTSDMLQNVDVLVFDIQDVGARWYTYISTLNYVMEAAGSCGKPVIVLDRPDPLGGEIVEGPVLEDRLKTFVGVDNIPMAHGMTVGELARFFNRPANGFNTDLTVVPMQGYTRDMIWQDTGLDWIPTSPNIPTIESVFCYMATGLGEGTGVGQRDKFTWVGGLGIDSQRFADLLNGSNLSGVEYVPDTRGSYGGVKLRITDYRTFNPARSGLYALAYARQLSSFKVPKSGSTPTSIVLFDKIMGTDRVGIWLEQKLPPREIEKRYAKELEQFKRERQEYLIYGYAGKPGTVSLVVDSVPLFFDSEPYIDENGRTIAPIRAIAEALGAEVKWDQKRSEVTITNGSTVVSMTIGSKIAWIDGQRFVMDTVPVLSNSRTMVPVRYVSELLGATVDFEYSIDYGYKTVLISRQP